MFLCRHDRYSVSTQKRGSQTLIGRSIPWGSAGQVGRHVVSSFSHHSILLETGSRCEHPLPKRSVRPISAPDPSLHVALAGDMIVDRNSVWCDCRACDLPGNIARRANDRKPFGFIAMCAGVCGKWILCHLHRLRDSFGGKVISSTFFFSFSLFFSFS